MPAATDAGATATLACQSVRPLDTQPYQPILVPFSPETDLSGVRRQLKPDEVMWYRRDSEAPALSEGQHCLLHFEAVDDTCAVWVNGELQGTHQGGYAPFAFDITAALKHHPGMLHIDAAVTDPSDKGIQLRGKQSLNPHAIWYTAQSGIWQPVWLEVIPEAHIREASIAVDANTRVITVRGQVSTAGSLRVEVWPCATEAEQSSRKDALGSLQPLQPAGKPVAQGEAKANNDGEVEVTISVPNAVLWSPDCPVLYGVDLEFYQDENVRSDVVHSYCAFRSVCLRADNTGAKRVFLNNEPVFLRGVLNQGYWPESLMTAPDDAAFIHDIREMQHAGMNMMRVHIKVEARRFYYLCDRLGMLVWQDMVSGGGEESGWRVSYAPTLSVRSWQHYADDTPDHQRALGANNARYQDIWLRSCEETIAALAQHPCVITWILFNEGWGQFSSGAACERVRALDPTRPVHAVSGWYDQGFGDFFGVHNYFRPMRLFRDRRGNAETPGQSRALVVDEFGGLVCNVSGHAQFQQSFGYDTYATVATLAPAVRNALEQAEHLQAKGLAGYVYTQVSDVEEETNGILTYDRKVNKLDC